MQETEKKGCWETGPGTLFYIAWQLTGAPPPPPASALAFFLEKNHERTIVTPLSANAVTFTSLQLRYTATSFA